MVLAYEVFKQSYFWIHNKISKSLESEMFSQEVGT